MIKHLDTGGAEAALVERMKAVSRDGVQYTMIVLSTTTTVLTDQIRAAGVDLVDLSDCPGKLVYWRLAATVKRLSPHVVNVHSPLPAVMLRLATRLWRRKPRLIHTVSGIKYHPVTMLADRLTRRLDDCTVAWSPLVVRSPTVAGARRVMVRIHGIDLQRQRYWAARADIVRRELDVPDEAFLIVSVANLRACKNHQMLILVANVVLRARPDALFLLAGDGPLRAQLTAEIQRRGLEDRVRILGRVPDAYRLIAAADLLVLSSHNEGLPVVIMEAFGAGVPVVSTAVGGVPDIVISGKNGILTRPGSPDALAAGLLKAMEPDEHRRLRSQVATVDPEVLDMRTTARWFEELYAELVRKA